MIYSLHVNNNNKFHNLFSRNKLTSLNLRSTDGLSFWMHRVLCVKCVCKYIIELQYRGQRGLTLRPPRRWYRGFSHRGVAQSVHESRLVVTCSSVRQGYVLFTFLFCNLAEGALTYKWVLITECCTLYPPRQLQGLSWEVFIWKHSRGYT